MSVQGEELMKDVLAVVLAGGKGARLEPLTRDRAKPAVPFGGAYRIIDFTMSNCLNSGIRRILVLTQYKAASLARHIHVGWQNYFCRELGEFVDVVPPQQRIDEHWYRGTADAVYQNIYTMEKEQPEYTVILAGDHIYKMNYRKMVKHHIANKADLTIGVLAVPVQEAKNRFGVMEIGTDNRVVGFEEKPEDPKPVPGDSHFCYASMGIYVFTTRFLFEQLCQDATRPGSTHDFGGDVIPSTIHTHRIFAHPFLDENRKDSAYWRDVGTLDAYYEANMDLIAVDPLLNMYDDQWPLRTFQPNLPPPKFVFAADDRRGYAMDSIVCPGSIVSGGQVRRSILGPKTRVNSFAQVDQSILFGGVDIGRHAKIRRAIIDKGVRIPAGFQVGYDHDVDQQRGFTVTDRGVTVIAKTDGIEHVLPDGEQTEIQETPYLPGMADIIGDSY
ncbi:MAG: glucose-1-phosphate adenylyltransferase [Pirellulales bacterium]|nr:glucose-1-phosphate adenylyltransferase [Pirellulales bacterium]